jgi:hypothetical protein
VAPKLEEGADSSTPTEKQAKQVKFTYKYHEGSSNAVKLPIKIADLFKRD